MRLLDLNLDICYRFSVGFFDDQISTLHPTFIHDFRKSSVFLKFNFDFNETSFSSASKCISVMISSYTTQWILFVSWNFNSDSTSKFELLSGPQSNLCSLSILITQVLYSYVNVNYKFTIFFFSVYSIVTVREYFHFCNDFHLLSVQQSKSPFFVFIIL